MSLIDLSDIPKIIEQEGLEVGVVSYGGSATNTLVKYLEMNGIKCITPIWKQIVCHCPEPIRSNIKFIYVHRNPRDAFISQKVRGSGYWDVNQMKLGNTNDRSNLSDENLIRLMYRQRDRWMSAKRDNILTITYEELFSSEGKKKIEEFLGKKLKHYPEYRRIDFDYTISPNLENLFKVI